MLRDQLTRVVGAAAGLVLATGLATVAVRTGRSDAFEVARALDRVEGLELVGEDRVDRGADPCRGSAIVLAEEPDDVRTRDYVVTDGATAVVGVGVYDFGDSSGARDALRAARERLSMCRGFRSTTSGGQAFRFEYLSIEESGIGAEGYVVRATGRSETGGIRTDNRNHVFRRGQFVVIVAWQSVRAVADNQVRCVAELADAVARNAAARRCSAVPVLST